MMTCKIDGCGKCIAAKGLCWGHYRRLRSHGDPLGGRVRYVRSNGAGKRWIEENAGYQGDDCLIWPFSRAERKVGGFHVGSEFISSYRYMCLVAHGDPPPGRNHAAHSCGNGAGGCVNPNHLRWATHQENMEDKVLHGTHPRGVQCYNAKLDADAIRFIKRNAGKIKNRAMARMLGVHEVTIGQIIAGKRWAHIDVSD